MNDPILVFTFELSGFAILFVLAVAIIAASFFYWRGFTNGIETGRVRDIFEDRTSSK